MPCLIVAWPDLERKDRSATRDAPLLREQGGSSTTTPSNAPAFLLGCASPDAEMLAADEGRLETLAAYRTGGTRLAGQSEVLGIAPAGIKDPGVHTGAGRLAHPPRVTDREHCPLMMRRSLLDFLDQPT